MKKFLSLVLALVMTMSLVTVSAGAKDFTDDGDITYDEAVAVMSAVGVIDGYTDGSFQPTTNLTRGAAAKIICNLILGPTTAAALGADTAPYSDVPVTNTFAGYIAYCQKEGIISGYADGTFRPSAPLTGYAFMKMLLGALGYDAAKESYTGANWSVNVAKQAIAIGLDDGNDEFVGQASVNREEAMLYAFNTMKATMVEYPNDTTVIVGDTSISTSGKASKVEDSGKHCNNIDDDGYMQFAEVYFTKLVKNGDTSDVFERPAHTWKFDGDKVGTYADEADTIAVVDDKNMEVEDVLLDSDYMNYDADEVDSKVDVYLNGEGAELTTKVNKGDIVEAFENDDNEVVTVVVRRYTAAKIDEVDDDLTSADTKKGASVEMSLTDLEGNGDYGTYFDAYENDKGVLPGYNADYEEGSVLAVALAGGEVIDSYLADTDSGKVTSFKAEGSVTLDGTKYSFAGKVDGITDDFDFDYSYNVYMTAEGYVIGVEGTSSVTLDDVYFVTGVYGEQSKYNADRFTFYAQAVSLADGSVTDIELEEQSEDEKSALKDVVDSCAAGKGEWKPVTDTYLYTFDKDGVATAWESETEKDCEDYQLFVTRMDGDDLKVTSSRIETDAKNFYVDENTRYLNVVDSADDIDTAYAVGGMKAAAGDFDVKGNVIVIADLDETRDAVYVLLVGEEASAISEDVIYVADSGSFEKVANDRFEGTVWFMDGAKSQEIVVDATKAPDQGKFYTYEIDEDVYTLDEQATSDSSYISDLDSGFVTDDSTGWYIGVNAADESAIYRDKLTDTDGSVKFDDVSVANAKVIDARDGSYSAYAYDKEINSLSRLIAALEKGEADFNVYVDEGDITFIAVTDSETAGADPDDDKDEAPKNAVVEGIDTAIANNAASLKNEGAGAYIVTGTSTDFAADVRGDLEENIFFVFETVKDNQPVALTIRDEDGKVVYKETAIVPSAGGHFFYVQVASDDGVLINKGIGSMATEALAYGLYSWDITGGGETLAAGDFEIAE